MSNRISVVIPVWREDATIHATIAAVARLDEDAEILVVDGDPSNSTLRHLELDRVRGTSAPKGRASQMNAGAGAATGDVLLFLHADTRLPTDALDVVTTTLEDPAIDGGCFELRLDDDSHLLRLYSRFINLRTRWSRVPVGDQAIFLRREVFERLGGYPDVPLLEEIILMRRFARAGHRLRVLPGPVVASARRFDRDGRLRRILLNWWIVLLYYLGASPSWLHRWYWDDAESDGDPNDEPATSEKGAR